MKIVLNMSNPYDRGHILDYDGVGLIVRTDPLLTDDFLLVFRFPTSTLSDVR